MELCEDLWVPDKPSTHAALAGANIIANLSASDELTGKHHISRNPFVPEDDSERDKKISNDNTNRG